jgi:hypothetical protein
MAVSLRKVAEHAAGQRIDLLREKADVVAAREQAVEEPPGFGVAALQHVIIDEPEAAGEEGAFARGEAVDGVLGVIPQNEFILDQKPLLDGAEGSADARG